MLQNTDNLTLSDVLPGLLDYMSAERRFRTRTADNYIEDIRFFVKLMGELNINSIELSSKYRTLSLVKLVRIDRVVNQCWGIYQAEDVQEETQRSIQNCFLHKQRSE